MKKEPAKSGLLAAVAALCVLHCAPPTTGGPLRQEAYVWQRSWTPAVREAVRGAGDLDGLVLLQAQVDFDGAGPRLVDVPVDFETLRQSRRRVGLALRIGPYAGEIADDEDVVTRLTGLAAAMVERARREGLEPSELQIDYDCPTSRLDGYRRLLTRLRRRVAPLPVTWTALPDWLEAPGFQRLVDAADGYVLQVHSLELPRSADGPLTLCDPAAARRAVEQAGRYGRPFRVALSTYSYEVAFAADGSFLGLSAEGLPRRWPADARLRLVASHPDEIAALVSDWTARRPRALTGIVWYRLPVSGDRRNWPPATFDAVRHGRPPRGDLRTEVRRPQAGLAEIVLRNAGERREDAPARIRLRWEETRPLARDALAGYRFADAPGGARLLAADGKEPDPLQPGEERTLAWLRWPTKNEEVQIAIEN